MSIDRHAGNPGAAGVVSAEAMLRAIKELGIVPFFENPIRGYSIEELTPREFWFDGESDTLGPWDWKVFCVQSGDIAYGKFLWGGKAAFATPDLYHELMNYRRSLPKYQPAAEDRKVLDFLAEDGTVASKDIRRILGLKKSGADAAATRLQMQCRMIIGDIARVYSGPDLHYSGWQRASFCAPEALFGWSDKPAAKTLGPGGFPFADDEPALLHHTPEESLQLLTEHILKIAPGATERHVLKMLG